MSIHDISALVINYNNPLSTIQCVSSLLNQQKASIKIIIVDNNSPDQSSLIFEKEFINHPSIQVLKNPINGGYAYAINRGYEHVQAQSGLPRYVAIVNNDIIFDDHLFFHKLIKTYATLKAPALITAKQVSPTGFSVNSGWRLPSIWLDIALRIPILKRIAKKRLEYSTHYMQALTPAVEACQGAFFLGSIDVFNKLFPLDERTFLYGEERILGWKVRQLGLINYTTNICSFTHLVSETISKEVSTLNRRKLHINSIKLYHRYYTKANRIGLLIFDLLCKVSHGILYIRIKASKIKRHS